MARKAGIAGFCFYHYYFCGKKLLEKPIEAYRDRSGETFPYCLIWANQSWMRTWYRAGTKKIVLQQQNYGRAADWEAHFYYLLDFFKDERYIKIDGKPVYVIYLPQDIRCRKQMFAVWQRLARENGLPGICLIAMNTSYGRDQSAELYDALWILSRSACCGPIRPGADICRTGKAGILTGSGRIGRVCATGYIHRIRSRTPTCAGG